MPPHLSKEIRERIVVWSNTLGKPNDEIASLAACSERTVREVLRLHRVFGVVHNPFAQPRGGTRLLDIGDLNYISSLILANPVLYLDEVQDKLVQYRNIEVSLSTISRAMQHLALTHKKVSAEAIERNELLRATWQAEYGDIPADYCVWLDESSVDNRTNHRQSGWATIGQACVRPGLFVRGQRYSVLPALSYEGYIAYDIFEGSVNKEKFLRFLNEQVVSLFNFFRVFLMLIIYYKAPQLNPYPGPLSVVILDNCSIHHEEDVRSLIEDECGM